MNATDRSIYLGDPSSDPPPVWREDAPDAFEWPEGAVFAVVFNRPSYAMSPMSFWAACYGDVPSFTQLYGNDGWPVDFPNERKDLSEIMRREIQVSYCGWETWDEAEWKHAKRYPHLWLQGRAQRGAMSSKLVTSLTDLARDLAAGRLPRTT
jgi:hypothetical protein